MKKTISINFHPEYGSPRLQMEYTEISIAHPVYLIVHCKDYAVFHVPHTAIRNFETKVEKLPDGLSNILKSA